MKRYGKIASILLAFIIILSLLLSNTLTGLFEVTAVSVFDSFYKNSIKNIINKEDEIKLPRVEKKDFVTKKIFQTHEKIDLIPGYYIKNLKKINPDYEYVFHDSKERVDFIQKYYGKKFVDKMNSFKRGAHKADLWRLCVLYKYGGCYIDADLVMQIPFDEVIDKCQQKLIIPQTELPMDKKRIFNALIMCNPGNELIGKCLKKIMLVDQKNLTYHYHFIIQLMGEILKNKIKYNIIEKCIHKHNINLYLSNPDNFYVTFRDNTIIAKSKRSDYI